MISKLPLVLVFACLAAAPPGGEAPSAPVVEVAEARREAVSVRAASVGTLEAEQRVELRAEVEGVVAAILVAEGDAVRRGQTLVRLDDRELAAQVAAAEASVERARTEAANLATRLERNRGLLDAGAISPQALDDLESASRAAEARTAEAEANLRLTRRRLEKSAVRAPFAGRVGDRSFYVGDYLQEGDVLMELVDDRPLRVEFDLPEAYLGRVEAGSPVNVTARSLPDREVPGRVVFVSPRIDPTNRTLRIEAEVANPEGLLKPGQFVDVEIELERRAGAVVVPEEAVVPRGGENFVFVVAEGEAELRPVELGERQPGRWRFSPAWRPASGWWWRGSRRSGTERPCGRACGRLSPTRPPPPRPRRARRHRRRGRAGGVARCSSPTSPSAVRSSPPSSPPPSSWWAGWATGASRSVSSRRSTTPSCRCAPSSRARAPRWWRPRSPRCWRRRSIPSRASRPSPRSPASRPASSPPSSTWTGTSTWPSRTCGTRSPACAASCRTTWRSRWWRSWTRRPRRSSGSPSPTRPSATPR